jgi:hypothetical protein
MKNGVKKIYYIFLKYAYQNVVPLLANLASKLKKCFMTSSSQNLTTDIKKLRFFKLMSNEKKTKQLLT